MTFSNKSSFTTTIIDEEFDDSADYPTAFGITFTPQVSGIALGLLGVVGMIYVLLNFFLPAWNDYQKLNQEKIAKQAQVDQESSRALANKFASAERQLKEAEQRKATVLQLYADSQDLQTILYNFNTLFTARDVKLLSFVPQGDPEVIGDDSLGAKVKNRLKRQNYQVSMVGDFPQTQNLIRDIERLQPLILMENMQTTVAQESIPVNVIRDGTKVEIQPETQAELNTTMTLQVYTPLTAEEIKALQPPPSEEDQPAEGGDS